MKTTLPRWILLACLCSSPLLAAEPPDIVVYGATPAGVMTAVSAARAGDRVLLLEPGYLVGGMMSGGLTKTDFGRKETIGGLSLEFFRRVKAHYVAKYGADSTQAKECHEGLFFEPHVADLVLSTMLQEAGVDVIRRQQLIDATVRQGHISTIRVHDTKGGGEREIGARVFVDATYEGDLMAAAGVLYRVGREARAEYGEPLAGITEGPPEYLGKGDHRTQAYNIRSTLTTRPDIRLPVPRPKRYTPELLQGYVDAVLTHNLRTFEDLFHLDYNSWGEVNGKSDPNNGDFVGINYSYPEADPEARAVILDRVQDYWLSLWYMLQNDPRLPEEFRESARRWGLPKDEFVESGHISPQLYVREARRMLGRHLLTQGDLERDRHKPDTICLGSYNIDSHTVQQFWFDGRRIPEEGYLTSSIDPYEIPYRAITPVAPDNLLVTCTVSATHIAYGSLRMEPVFMMIGEAAGNAAHLAVRGHVSVQAIPVKELQASLAAAGIPLRAPYRPTVTLQAPPASAEPGQPVGFHATVIEGRAPLSYAWNFDGSGMVQSTDAAPTHTFTVAKPHTVSLKIIDADGNSSMVAQTVVQVGSDTTPDVEVDVKTAKFDGRWDRGASLAPQNRRRVNFHDMNADKGEKRVTFAAALPRAGRYRVAFAFQGGDQRAVNVPVTVVHAGGEAHLSINQRTGAAPFAFQPLGEFQFAAGENAKVIVSNAGTKGFVSVDAVRWIWLGN